MKKIIMILFALLCALIINELFVRYIVQYPVQGIDKRIFSGNIANGGYENIYFPYSKALITEEGLIEYKRNNLGLPGSEIHVNNNSKYIFVLGNSYLEARAIPSNLLASSILDTKLKLKDENYQVLNLGVGGYDPYSSFFRAKLFEKYYTPQKVLLVLVWDYFDKYQNLKLDFSLPKGFGTAYKSTSFEYISFLRNHFSSLNLYRNLINEDHQQETRVVQSEGKLSSNIRIKPIINIIEGYHKEFGDKLICVSVFTEFNHNKELTEFCRTKNIPFFYNANILNSNNRINGTGHLNILGNKELGDFLYEASIKNIQ